MSKELERLNEQRQIIQDAKEYLSGIEVAIMEHFGKRKS